MPLIGTVGSNFIQTTAGSLPVTLNTTLAAGKTIVGAVAVENGPTSTTNPVFTISDTHGNTYSVDKQEFNSGTIAVAIFSCRVTTQINSGDVITISVPGTRTKWLATLQAYDDLLASPVDQSASNKGNSNPLSAGTTPTTTVANELVYAAFGMGVRAFTAGSGFTASTQVATSAGSGDRALNSEWKYITSTGAQTAPATLASSSTYAGAVVTYKVSATNQPPTADAGPDQNVTISSTVTLDGTGSSDADGTITGYQWTQLSGPTVTLSSDTAAQPTFTAPASPTTLQFGLVVTDNNDEDSTQDTVTISVQNKIGFVAEVASGTSTVSSTSFSVDFTQSVQIGHTLLLGVVVDDTQNISPVLSVSDTQGNTYSVDSLGFRSYTMGVAVISCYVTNALTAADSLTVSVNTTRGRWVISALEFDNIHQNGFDVAAGKNGDPSTALVSGTTAVTQDQVEVVFAAFGFGTGGDPVFSAGPHYQQVGTQHATTAGSANRAVAAEYRVYTAPTTHQATATLTASVGYAGAIATYAADIISNDLPVANAGPDQTAAAFDTVTLDGTGSTDEDGVVEGYQWTQTDGPTVTLSSATAAQPTFTAPGSDGGTSVTFGLVVTDNLGDDSTNSSDVTVTVGSAEQFIAQSGSWEAIQPFNASSDAWQ